MGANNISELSFPPPAPPAGRGVFVQPLLIVFTMRYPRTTPGCFPDDNLGDGLSQCHLEKFMVGKGAGVGFPHGLIRLVPAGYEDRNVGPVLQKIFSLDFLEKL